MPPDATCWGSTPDPLEHDSHAAVRVCVSNAAQGQPHSYCAIKGGCCPTSEYVDSAIHMHCLPLAIGAISRLVGDKKRIEENQLASQNGHKLVFDIGRVSHF